MIYTQTLIKMLSLIGINVNQNRTNDKARTSRDRAKEQEHRASKGSPIQAGTNRHSIRQEKHRGTSSIGGKSIFRQLYEKGACCQYGKGTCEQKIKGRQVNRQASRASSTSSKRSIILPSFLFSYNSLLLLQSIDDICLHINPILVSYLIQTNTYIGRGV